MTTREKMRKGMLYTDMTEGLEEERINCKELIYDYNNTRPREADKRKELLKKILGNCGENIFIEPPLRMAYGKNTHIGENFYSNFNLVIVDDIEVYIGDNVMIAPNVTITATGHPIDVETRRTGAQFSKVVNIGNDVWIGSNVVILPGIKIGNGSIIGAGSIVTKDIPENVVAVGNPCKVLREITDRDKETFK